MEKTIDVTIRDEIKEGRFSNSMGVRHTKEEFMIDFMNIVTADNTGSVVSRIFISPGHFKRIVGALNENMKRYEDKFGKIEKAKFDKYAI